MRRHLPQRCPSCGRDGRAQRDPVGWLTGRAARTYVCAAGHEWHPATVGFLGYSRLGPPGHLWRVVWSHRTIEPSPAVWLGAGAVAIALGVIADRLLGLRWWVIASGALGVAWLGVAATALASPPVEGFPSALVGAVAPARGRAMAEQRLRRLLALTPGRALAPTGVDGERWISGYAASGRRGLANVELAHGTSVRVTTNWLIRYPHVLPAHHLALEVFETGEPPADWESAAIAVAGRPVPCTLLRAGEKWVARVERDGVVVDVAATGIPFGSFELAEADPDDYRMPPTVM